MLSDYKAMLTEEEKKAHFKRLQNKNYRASLRLEGIHLEGETHDPECVLKSESEQIADLTLRYAR